MKLNRPLVGVAAIIIKDGKVLLGFRVGKHGNKTWCFPGGHLEFYEELGDCARREVREETGIEIKNVRFATLTNDFHKSEGKHYITIYMLADWKSGEPKVFEPDKMVKWQWFDWENLPSPLFLPIQNLIKQGFRPL